MSDHKEQTSADPASQSIGGAAIGAAAEKECSSLECAPLGLPAPSGDSTAAVDSVKLDALGPVVVNSDGSVSRITNWHQMTKQEQENTQRAIAARNKQRLAALQHGCGGNN